jgi:hypothetical protein
MFGLYNLCIIFGTLLKHIKGKFRTLLQLLKYYFYMTEKQLLDLKKKLPKKWDKTIGAKLKLTPRHVRKVLDGDKNNILVIIEAIKLARIETKRKEKIEADLNSVLV